MRIPLDTHEANAKQPLAPCGRDIIIHGLIDVAAANHLDSFRVNQQGKMRFLKSLELNFELCRLKKHVFPAVMIKLSLKYTCIIVESSCFCGVFVCF